MVFLQCLEDVLLVVGEGLADRGIEELLFDRGVAGELLDDPVRELLVGPRRSRTGALEAPEQRADNLVVLFE